MKCVKGQGCRCSLRKVTDILDPLESSGSPVKWHKGQQLAHIGRARPGPDRGWRLGWGFSGQRSEAVDSTASTRRLQIYNIVRCSTIVILRLSNRHPSQSLWLLDKHNLKLAQGSWLSRNVKVSILRLGTNVQTMQVVA